MVWAPCECNNISVNACSTWFIYRDDSQIKISDKFDVDRSVTFLIFESRSWSNWLVAMIMPKEMPVTLHNCTGMLSASFSYLFYMCDCCDISNKFKFHVPKKSLCSTCCKTITVDFIPLIEQLSQLILLHWLLNHQNLFYSIDCTTITVDFTPLIIQPSSLVLLQARACEIRSFINLAFLVEQKSRKNKWKYGYCTTMLISSFCLYPWQECLQLSLHGVHLSYCNTTHALFNPCQNNLSQFWVFSDLFK